MLAGADDYLIRPIRPILLQARIGASLEKIRLRQRFTRQLRIFISSPGDVIAERRLVKQAIQQLDAEYGHEVQLVPVLWEEEPLVASETFQTQIIEPHDTDIYIAILWSRIGSPLPKTMLRPDGTQYESGTAYEFEDAMSSMRADGSPQMLMYRKTSEPTVGLADPRGGARATRSARASRLLHRSMVQSRRRFVHRSVSSVCRRRTARIDVVVAPAEAHRQMAGRSGSRLTEGKP